ncbi:MAG: AMP-binding protein, partial [Bacteroidota bacterium]
MTLQIKTFDQYKEVYQESIENPEKFWAKQAKTFTWRKPWKTVLEKDFRTPKVKWFVGGKLNITENCLDRHLEDRGDQTALIWEPNDPSQSFKTYTYRELYQEVCRAANMLKANGIKKGDRVCFYMPMVPELTIAVLACARIGAIHSVVFAGFSATALADRIKDATCKMVICSDYNNRGTKHIPVKQVVDDALKMGCDSVETVLVHKNTGDKVAMKRGRDKWWHKEIEGKRKACKAT